jgi:hypothetical protein
VAFCALLGAEACQRGTCSVVMDGDDVCLLEQLVLRDECGAHFSRALGREILAPGDHLHTVRVADLRHRTADVAEAQDSKRLPGHVITDRLLPAAAVQRRVLGDEIAGHWPE